MIINSIDYTFPHKDAGTAQSLLRESVRCIPQRGGCYRIRDRRRRPAVGAGAEHPDGGSDLTVAADCAAAERHAAFRSGR